MREEMWFAILSSALTSAVVSGVIGGWFSLRAGRNQYRNDYFKMVLERRVAAYETVERLIVMLKTSVLDTDKRPYHLLFAKDDDHEEVFKLMFVVSSSAMWLSDDLFEKTRDLNRLIYSDSGDRGGLIEFGKRNYREIAELRTVLERYHARDMLTLHDVPGFLRGRKPTDSYAPVTRRS